MTHAHTPEELRNAESNLAKAMSLFDAGFKSKADRKDAIRYLADAYRTLVNYEFNYTVWNSRVLQNDQWVYPNKAWEKLNYANFPELHIWAKNPDKWTKVYADFPQVVKRGNELAALRNKFEAAELVAKPKSKTAIQREAREATAKTCQICARKIFAETGVIAHHGYERPRWAPGNQTASCFGARHLPFEQDRSVLGRYIQTLKIQHATMLAHRTRIEEDKVPLSVAYGTGKYVGGRQMKTTFQVTRDTFDAEIAAHKPLARWPSDLPLSFNRLKERVLNALAREIAALRDHLAEQQERYDMWKAVQ